MGQVIEQKYVLTKKLIIWKNPANGFAIAALKDLDREIKLPNYLPNYDENFESFKSMWTSLDYDIKIMFENVKSHVESNEY